MKQADDIGKSLGFPNQKELVAAIIERARAAGVININSQESASDDNGRKRNGEGQGFSAAGQFSSPAAAPAAEAPILSERKACAKQSTNWSKNSLTDAALCRKSFTATRSER